MFCPAMGQPGSNVFSLEETIEAERHSVFEALTDLGKMRAFLPTTTSIAQLSAGPFGVGTRWAETRRVLFLRDQLTLECVVYEPQKGELGYFLDDGCNMAHYQFLVQPLGPSLSHVHCQVECWQRMDADVNGPSERLARMMEKNENKVLARLKGFVESQAQTAVSVC